ncbi:MAG: hypothetical protein GC184_11790 [Rhizobiales bacterium]|nr:hypothetical protein [Hyphomicrobiales bacterium]
MPWNAPEAGRNGFAMIWKKLLGGRALFGGKEGDDSPYLLYRQLVERSRQPVFYLDFGIPDTVEGRFEMISLHAFLTMRRLKHQNPEAKAFGQKVFDVMFDDMDQAMREMGVSDLRVGKKIKALAESFFGRIVAYEDGLAAPDDTMLQDVLARNVYGEVTARPEQLSALAGYIRASIARLDTQPVSELMGGNIQFADIVPPVLPSADEVSA